MMKKLGLLLIMVAGAFVMGFSTDLGFRKGYIVTNSNDTIYGAVKHHLAEAKNCAAVWFKTEGNEVKKYQPGDIKAYCRANNLYVSKNAERHYNLLGDKRVFMRQIQKGTMNLYVFNYVESANKRYQCNEGPALPYSYGSDYYIEHSNQLQLVKKSNFRKEMAKNCKACADLALMIYNKEFGYKDLAVIAEKFNKKMDGIIVTP